MSAERSMESTPSAPELLWKGQSVTHVVAELSGITMAQEIWELLRLFFPSTHLIVRDDARTFDDGGIAAQEQTGALRLHLSAEVLDDRFTARVCAQCPGMPDAVLCDGFILPAQPTPLDLLAHNRKIRMGEVMYRLVRAGTGKTLPWGSLMGVRPSKLAHVCLDAGLTPAQGMDLLENCTAMQPEKAALLMSVAERERPWMGRNDTDFHVYVGIPFCVSRCLYCSFTAYPTARYGHLRDAYLDALELELQTRTQAWQAELRRVRTIYVGGGTPTALTPHQLDRLLALLEKYVPMQDVVEYTVEAGRPDTLDEQVLRILQHSRCNRISINPQTMNAETLHRIGRSHTPECTEQCFHLARSMGFRNINMDLIAGLPGETPEMFAHTLSRIRALKPDSLTVHTMAVKRASRLHEEQGLHDVTRDDVVQEMIRMGAAYAAELGMEPYYLYRQKNILANLENVGYALPEKPGIHNIVTMMERQDVEAFGAGAITKHVDPRTGNISRVFNPKEVAEYIRRQNPPSSV